MLAVIYSVLKENLSINNLVLVTFFVLNQTLKFLETQMTCNVKL